MKIICACDSFKECLSAKEVGTIFCKSWQEIIPNCQCINIPLSDGGEGLLDILPIQTKHCIDTLDPLMRPISVNYGRYRKDYFVEMASSCGLPLLSAEERNPIHTTSYGLGKVIHHICHSPQQLQHPHEIYIGLGGTATNDAGLGCLQALGVRFYDTKNQILEKPITGKDLLQIASYKLSDTWNILKRTPITLICDVSNPLYGKEGASYTFAKQKGANDQEIEILDQGLRHLATVIEKQHPNTKLQSILGGGAAGGIAALMHHFLKAEIKTGIDVILDILQFDKQLTNTDLVITGEGKLDNQTLSGKVAYGVLQRCKTQNIPTIAIAGQVEDKTLLLEAGFHSIYCINDTQAPLSKQLEPSYAIERIRITAQTCAMQHLHR